MSFGFSPQRVDGLRFDARCLVEWLRDQEAQVAMFVASADGDLRQAEADVSPDAAALGPNELRHLLASQLERRLATASAASSLRPASSMRRRVVYCTSSKVATPTVNKQAPPCSWSTDYADVRDVLAHVLEGAGFVVRTAANGLEALIAAYEIRPGVIVMDVSMSVLDGIQATRLIKAEASTREARVIAFTGNASLGTTETRALFAEVLSKPAPPSAVLAAVRRVTAL